MLESGAEDGLHASNSLFLQRYSLWHSVLVEPGPANFEMLEKNREDGCLLLHAAICDRPRTVHFIEHLAVGGIVEFMAKAFLKEWWPKIDVSHLEVSTILACSQCAAPVATNPLVATYLSACSTRYLPSLCRRYHAGHLHLCWSHLA